jgi:hypothetical protein
MEDHGLDSLLSVSAEVVPASVLSDALALFTWLAPVITPRETLKDWLSPRAAFYSFSRDVFPPNKHAGKSGKGETRPWSLCWVAIAPRRLPG